MSQEQHIWVRTSTLDRSVYGEVKSSTRRLIHGASVDERRHWGWVQGRIINASDKKVHPSGLKYSPKEDIKVFIEDSESAHNCTEVMIKGSAIRDGDLIINFPNNPLDGKAERSVHSDFHNGEEKHSNEGYGHLGSASDNDDDGDDYPDDLIALKNLHEPSVINCLRERYAREAIYTSAGPILIALNPYKNYEALYSEAVMKKYLARGQKQMSESFDSSETEFHCRQDELPPHVYGIADKAFRGMMAKLKEQGQTGGGTRRRAPPSSSSTPSAAPSCNQSILILGESGAGKTVTAKFIMRYLATMSRRCAQQETDIKTVEKNVDLEQQVLQSNHILESFGNARTIRNDSSSRFGKFIEIQFTRLGHVAGASIETYFLEKGRLVYQTEGERNYQIFYELLEGLPDEDLDRYFLSDYTAEDFLMTNQSGAYDRRDGIDDHDTYQDLLVSMKTMGFSMDEQTDIITIASALLHASNLTFNAFSTDGSHIERENRHLDAFLSLMGLGADEFSRALCYSSVQAKWEVLLKRKSVNEARKALLALIKAIYSALFTYVVERVNESFASFHSKFEKGRRRTIAAASIGVLDFFGFESFKTNSFEQLCINYCNEMLQQQFNSFALKNEQEEYAREGINWSYVSFPDNQDALDLIERQGTGVLDILDGQYNAPGASDQTFVIDLYQRLSHEKVFEADLRQRDSQQFSIAHYAGTVEYSSEGFVEKNRDELPKEASELLFSSSNEFLRKLAVIVRRTSHNNAVEPQDAASVTTTVGEGLKLQLKGLRHKIELTTPHYVRCLKSNDEFLPGDFDPLVVAEQLRCAGIIEAVRVYRLGFPKSFQYKQFVTRYNPIGQQFRKLNGLPHGRNVVDLFDITKAVIKFQSGSHGSGIPEIKASHFDAMGLQLGRTKVFMRRKLFDTLEYLLSHYLIGGATAARSFCTSLEKNCRSIDHLGMRDLRKLLNETLSQNEKLLKNEKVLNVKVKSLRNSKSTLKQTVQYTRKELDQAKIRNSLLQQAVDNALSELAETTTENDHMSEKINLQHYLLRESTAKQESLEDEKWEMQSHVTELEVICEAKEEEATQISKDMAELKQKMEDCREELLRVQQTADKMDSEKLLEEIDSLKEELMVEQKSCNEEKVRADEAESKLRETLVVQGQVKEKESKWLSQISELEILCASKQDEETRLRHEMDALKDKLESCKKDMADVKSTSDDNSAELVLAKAQNDALTGQINEQQLRINSTQKELDRLHQNLVVLQRSCNEEKLRADQAESELRESLESKGQLEDKENNLLAQISELEILTASKEEEVLRLCDEMDELRDELESCKKDMSSVEFTADDNSIELVLAKAQNDALIEQLDEQQQRIESSKKDLTQLQQSYNEEKVRADKAESELRESLVVQKRLRTDKSDLLSQISNVETLCASKGDEVAQLSNELKGLRKDLKSATSQDTEENFTVKKKSHSEEEIYLQQNGRSTRDEFVQYDDAIPLSKSEPSRAETEPSTSDIGYHSTRRNNDDDTVQSSASSAKIKLFEELAVHTTPPKQKLEKVLVRPMATNDVCNTPVEKVDNTQGLESAEKYKLVKELADLREKLAATNKDLACLRKERISFRTAISETRKNIDTSKAEVMNFKDHFEHDKKTAQKFSILFDSMRTENENLVKENDKQARKLKLLNATKQEKKQLVSEVSALRNDLGHAIVDRETLHEKKVSLELTIENMLEMWSLFSKKKAHLNRRLRKMTKELAKMKRGVTHLKQIVEDGKVALKQSTAEILAARVENRRLMQKVARHEDQIKSAEEENDKLSEELLELREKLEVCTAEIQSLCEMNTSLKEDLDNARNELNESENARAHLVQTAGAPTTDFVARETKKKKFFAKKQRQKEVHHIEDISAIKFERDRLAAKLSEELEAAEAAKVQLRAMGEELNEQKVVNKKLQDALEHKCNSKCADGVVGSMTNGVIDKSTTSNNETIETTAVSTESTEGDEQSEKEIRIAHLKDTISCLKAELKAAHSPAKADRLKELPMQKNETMKDNAGQTSGMDTVDKQIETPVDDKQKLMDSIVVKDEEIKALRREIASLCEQFDLSTVSSMSDTLSDMKPAFMRGTASPSSVCEYNKEVVELRSLNNKLEKELEEVRSERDQLIRTIEAERNQATNELTAFAIALNGVDELRVAAEQMSTEITKLKHLDDDDCAQPEDSKDGREIFQKFKRTMGKATLKSEQKGLWKQLRLDVESLNEKVREKTMDYAKGAVGHQDKDNDDDRTISSSFF